MGCRVRGSKAELLRLVRAPEPGAATTILVDLEQSRPGRGAYLHRQPECLELAVRKRALGRALRSPAPEADQVRQSVQPHLPPPDGTT